MKADVTVLQKSPHLVIIDNGNNSLIVWHSLFGYPMVISRELLNLLQAFENPQESAAVLGNYEIDADPEALFLTLINSHFLILPNINERLLIRKRWETSLVSLSNGSRINYLELIMTEECNFRCAYCIHFGNLGGSHRHNVKNKFMKFEVAKGVIDRFLAILRGHKKKVAEINFGGGEPLLVWPVIKRVLKYCRDVYGNEFGFRFSINTNASLVDPEIALFLKEYAVSIASSLDGSRDGHDRVRLTKSGQGTYDIVLRGFNILSSHGYPLNGFAVTVDDYNFSFLDETIIDFASDRQMKNVSIDIDVIGIVDVPVSDIVKKLMRLRRYASGLGIDVSGFWSRPAENLNDSIIDRPVAFCGAARGNSLCVNSSGDVYVCGYSSDFLESFRDLEIPFPENSPYIRVVRDSFPGMIKSCEGCILEGQCAGGCIVAREYDKTKGDGRAKKMCEFYRQMTRELVLEQMNG